MTNRREFPATDIYGITAECFSRGKSNLDVIAAMIRQGIKIVQYREKEKSLRQQYAECLAIRDLTRKAGVCFIVNDHVDLALAVGADGVHIGQDDLPPRVVRSLVGEEMIIGLSTHSPEQARAALTAEVDYIGAGPVFATATKQDVVSPVGLEYVEFVAQNIPLPFVAIGGIKEHNITAVWARGAKCCALVTELVEAEDMGKKIEAIRGLPARLPGEREGSGVLTGNAKLTASQKVAKL